MYLFHIIGRKGLRMLIINCINTCGRWLIFVLAAILVAFCNSSMQAQVVQKDTVWQLNADTASTNLWLGGYSDAENTRIEGPIYHQFSIGFQPMRYLQITNLDTVPIHTPRVIINQSRMFYTREMAASEALQNTQTPKEKAWSMFNFVRQNRVHLDAPEHTHSAETHDPIKVLSVYGFGFCDDAANTLRRLSQVAGYPALEWGITAHSLAEVDFGMGMSLLDPDIEVFYPNYNHSKWIGKDDAVFDRYLISRVHHYGRSQPFIPASARYVASMFVPFANLDNRITDTFQIRYTLRPQQQLQMHWDSVILEHRNFNNTTPGSAHKYIIGNAKWLHTLTPYTSGFQYQIDDTVNVKSDTTGLLPGFSPANPLVCADMVWKVHFPFPHLDHRIQLLLNLPNSDNVQVEWSLDSVLWQPVASFTGPKLGWDSCSLYNVLNPLVNAAIYSGFIRIRICQAHIALPAGIDSMSLLSITQISKNFQPHLNIGNNVLAFSHADTGVFRHVKIELGWQEEQLNRPPQVNPNPVYPGVGLQTDTALIRFRWGHAWDPDGDPIAEYHFRLSDRPDMLYPIAPNYDRYISPSGSLLPAFRPEVPGFLEHGQTYYWQVRARDAKGLWGDWGPVWNFTPRCVMQPHFSGFQVSDTAFTLLFQPSNFGKVPVSYEIHASNEMYGFTPESSTRIGITQHNYFHVPHASNQPPPAFYRIIAVDSFGQKSAPSVTFDAPFPYVFGPNRYLILPDSNFTLQLKGNRRTFTWFHYFYPDTLHYDAWVSPISYPPFLTWDSQNAVFTGSIDTLQARTMLFDSALYQIQFQVIAPQVQPQFQIIQLESGVQNRKPLPSANHQAPVLGQAFQDTIFLLDGDAFYGDTHTWRMLQGPAWLQLQANNDTLILQGIPDYAALHDTIWKIEVVDYRGLADTLTIQIQYTHINQPPQINSLPDTTIYAFQMYQYPIHVLDPDAILGDTFLLTLVQAPAWLSYNPLNRELQGFPFPYSNQSSPVKIRVQDMHGDSAEQQFVIYVKQMIGMDTLDLDSTLAEIVLDDAISTGISNIIVFPNPLYQAAKMRIELVQNAFLKISIYSTEGKQIRSVFQGYRESGVRQMNLNTEGLSSGLYLLNLELQNEHGEQQFHTTRIIIP